MCSLALKVDCSWTPRHIQLDSEDELPVHRLPLFPIIRGDAVVFHVGQLFGHCDEPGAFFGFERLLVDLLHHFTRETRAVAED